MNESFAAAAIKTAAREAAAREAAVVPSEGDYLLAAETAGRYATVEEVEAVAHELARFRVGEQDRTRANARIWMAAYRREGLKGLPSYYDDLDKE